MTFMTCAAMLASAVALNSCKSDIKNGPLGEEDIIKTEFAISIPDQASNGAKRMPSANVPEDNDFLGMKNIALIPFVKQGAITSTDTRLGGTNIAGITDIAADGLTATGNAKVYSNISIPLATASFLIYAQSAPTGTNHQIGKLVATGIEDGAAAGIHFDLASILGEAEKDLDDVYTDATAVKLITLLNNVANATDGATPTPKKWKNYVMGIDDEGMSTLFAEYKTMSAFSSFKVGRMLMNLYTTVEPYKSGKPGAAEPVASLADHIQQAIEEAITVTREGGVATGAVTAMVLKNDYDGYPANLGLPEGAVRIKYDAVTTEAFVACEEGDYNTQTNPILYAFPASLWHYANSTIKTADISMNTQLTSANPWADIIAAYTAQSKPAYVNAGTKSVAIVNPIQYAVGRFDVQVKLVTTTLKDQAGHDVTMPVGGFPVTAVFVGNQRRVMFDFTPTTESAPLFTIYDNALTGIYASTALSNVNSLFVLETPAATVAPTEASATADVQIALELTNTSTGDFYGANGQLIPKDGKFYLIATLTASNASETEKKVFKQDYKTTAQLTVKSLANAYSVIPDLRTPQLELGMSVDLTWEAGHDYAIDIP